MKINKMPHLEVKQGMPTFMVHGEPFIMLGGEIHNSSASNPQYMEEDVWPYLRDMNLNSLIVPVYWEIVEEEEGVYDFSSVQKLIEQARREGVKLVFLWFGLWKNSESMYIPSWMKKNSEKYFYAQTYYGERINTISPLCLEAVDKDASAFRELMAFIKKEDEEENTVLMVQVENEIGLLGSERDYSAVSNQVFNSEIPKDIADLYQVSGTWEEAFGTEASECFSAYCFARAIEQIAKTGKEAYHLPLYVNAWLEQFPWRAGSYPSGGPVMKMEKMWKHLAPTIEFLAPDIYVPYAPKVMDEYSRSGNVLFIPEIRKDAIAATFALYAVGGCHAIGFAPFGIEELQMPSDKVDKIPMEVLMALNIDPSAFDIEGSAKYLSKSYELIGQIQPLYYQHRGTRDLQAFIRKNSEEHGTVLSYEDYDLQINYSRKERYQPESGGIVIRVAKDEFYILGCKFHFRFLPKAGAHNKVNYVTVEEGMLVDGKWNRQRVLNGDERMRLELKDMPSILRVVVC